MTKKHFIALADSWRIDLNVALCTADHPRADIAGISLAIRSFADVAERINPRFDEKRFFEACGLLPSGHHKTALMTDTQVREMRSRGEAIINGEAR